MTSQQLRTMSKEMYNLYENGNAAAESVAKALASARRAAMALEAVAEKGGSLGGFEGSAKREINAAIAKYEAFKATL